MCFSTGHVWTSVDRKWRATDNWRPPLRWTKLIQVKMGHQIFLGGLQCTWATTQVKYMCVKHCRHSYHKSWIEWDCSKLHLTITILVCQQQWSVKMWSEPGVSSIIKTNRKHSFYLIQYHNNQHQKHWTYWQCITMLFFSSSKLKLSTRTSSYCYMSRWPDLNGIFYHKGLYGKLTNETAEQLGYRPIGVDVRQKTTYW